MVLNTLEVDDGPVVVGQVFFDFEENSSNVNYLVYEDPEFGYPNQIPFKLECT